MPRPKLLLLAGVGWSATTPLWLTLKEQKIISTGVCKEPAALYWLSHKNSNLWENERGPRYESLLSSRSEYKLKNSYLLFSKDSTLDNYIEYYKWLFDDRDIQYASDFSNYNSELSPEFISEIAPALKNNFDVRVIFIVRDPVRRSYSQTSADFGVKLQHRFNRILIKKRFPDSISYWKHLLKQEKCNVSKFSYVSIYRKYAEHFPTFPIVMEDLWSGNTKPLEDFLECKIDGLHRNCYYPEMGTKAPQYEELEDQWSSDIQDLSEEDYAFGKKHTQWIYDEWYKQFKTRPWE